jgi:hypothetical protein
MAQYGMPTVLRVGPYRFFFYSSDREEPAHVHVVRERDTAKYWLDPISLARSSRFERVELSHIRRIIEEHQSTLLEAWNAYFQG